MVEILKLCLVNDMSFKFWRDADVWLRWLRVKILKFDRDLCLNLCYEKSKKEKKIVHKENAHIKNVQKQKVVSTKRESSILNALYHP